MSRLLVAPIVLPKLQDLATLGPRNARAARQQLDRITQGGALALMDRLAVLPVGPAEYIVWRA